MFVLLMAVVVADMTDLKGLRYNLLLVFVAVVVTAVLELLACH
jgi:hypothetical protein